MLRRERREGEDGHLQTTTGERRRGRGHPDEHADWEGGRGGALIIKI